MHLTAHGESVLLYASLVAFVAGVLIAFVPVPRWARITLLLSAPVVALVVGFATRPDPGCHYDCLGNGAWVFIVVPGALVGWYVGQGLGLALTRLLRLQRQRRPADT